VTAAAGSSTAGPSPPAASTAPSPGNTRGSHIVAFDPVEHRDIPDAAFDQVNHVPSDLVPQALARVVACDPGELGGYTTGTFMAGLCHTEVSLGDAIGQWARKNPGVPPRRFEELLQLLGRRGIRAVFIHETGVDAGGADRRQQYQLDRDGYSEEPPSQSPRGLPGHGWGRSAWGQRSVGAAGRRTTTGGGDRSRWQ